MNVSIKKTQARFKRVRVPDGPDLGIGEFFLLVDITAAEQAIYVPLSIASGKKPTGFIYQIEGTSESTISTTAVSCTGDSVTQVTLGTIVYMKIPAGKTATFRILVEMKGRAGKMYSVVINRINYKYNPSDARYQRFTEELSSKTVKFD